jgi:hypothetical protein
MDYANTTLHLVRMRNAIDYNSKILKSNGLSDSLIAALNAEFYEGLAQVTAAIAPPLHPKKSEMTEEQYTALWAKWNGNNNSMCFADFVDSFVHGDFDSIRILWCGMWLGIEKDGHTHS